MTIVNEKYSKELKVEMNTILIDFRLKIFQIIKYITSEDTSVYHLVSDFEISF